MKVKIKLAILGHLPHASDIDRIKKWKSSLFEITEVALYNINGDSDGLNWEYLDENIERNQLPSRGDANVLLAVTNVPLQSSYYARRFSDNRICMTFNEMVSILSSDNIPQVNLILKVLYAISFVYRRYGNRIPQMHEDTNFSHDETRGCIFDMNGIKTDIVYSLNKPQLCNSCIHALTNNEIPKNRIDKILIEKVQKELRKINKGSYYDIVDWVKKYPYWAITISSLSAVLLGMIGSLLATLLYHPKG